MMAWRTCYDANMICSMTSYSQKIRDGQLGSLIWEVRTVNHRFLEINLRCPEIFRDQEMLMRECVQKHLSRGKVDANLKFVPSPDLPVDFLINTALLEKLSEAESQVRHYFPDAIVNASEILSWKGVLQTVDTNNKLLNEGMLGLLDEALVELVANRRREGTGLGKFLQNNADKILLELEKIQQQLPAVLESERSKLKERFTELALQLDTQRLEQELVIWAQRADVAEELQRLEAHLQEIARVLRRGGVVGRRLDFLMQELNREANTLSSKSMHTAVTQSAVEMKVLIEQMREQVQNIE